MTRFGEVLKSQAVLYESMLISEKTEMGIHFNEKTVEVALVNQLGYERIAMACAASLAQMMGFSAERIEDVKTAVAEATINAMQHGNKGGPDAKVIISMHFKDDTLHIAVMDDGGGIKELPPKPDIDRIIENLDPPTGFGTFLIKELVDQVEFNEMTDGGHVVNMAIKL
jgi:serine/threonine-protein kinase RsbW